MTVLSVVQYSIAKSIGNKISIKKSKVEDLHSEEKNNNNGLEVKNDNGPINVFICYFSSPKEIRYIWYKFLSCLSC